MHNALVSAVSAPVTTHLPSASKPTSLPTRRSVSSTISRRVYHTRVVIDDGSIAAAAIDAGNTVFVRARRPMCWIEAYDEWDVAWWDMFLAVKGDIFHFDFWLEVLGTRSEPETAVYLSRSPDRRQAHVGADTGSGGYLSRDCVYHNGQMVWAAPPSPPVRSSTAALSIATFSSCVTSNPSAWSTSASSRSATQTPACRS